MVRETISARARLESGVARVVPQTLKNFIAHPTSAHKIAKLEAAQEAFPADAHAPPSSTASSESSPTDSAVGWFTPHVLVTQSASASPTVASTTTAASAPIASTNSQTAHEKAWFGGDVSLRMGEGRLAADLRVLDEESKHIFDPVSWSPHSDYLVTFPEFECFDTGAEEFEGTLTQAMEAIAPYLEHCDSIVIPSRVVSCETIKQEVIKTTFTPASFTKRMHEACAIREKFIDTCAEYACEPDTYQMDASVYKVLHVVGQCAKIAHGIITADPDAMKEGRKFNLIMSAKDLGETASLLFCHLYSSEDAAMKHEEWRKIRAAIATLRGHNHMFRIRRIDWHVLKLEHVFLMGNEEEEWVEGDDYNKHHTGMCGDMILLAD